VERPLRLVQLSDTHLFGDPGGRLMRVNTRHSFEATLNLALTAAARTDAVAITGDLVHDESAEGYQYLAHRLARLGLPCHCIPGNHDCRDLMDHWLRPYAVTHVAHRRLGPWNLILLDSTIPGEEAGHLKAHQLARVEALLAADAGPTLIFVHQHPRPIGSRWMDTMGIDNGGQLMALCARHPQVKALLFGHVHQEFDAQVGAVRLLGAPSTCVQFLPGSEGFAMDTRTPGFRELLLHPDGRLETSVVRLLAYPEPLEVLTGGY
jgi:Icc protein